MMSGEEDGEDDRRAWPHGRLRGVRVTGWELVGGGGGVVVGRRRRVISVPTPMRSSAAAERRPRQTESMP